jgi:FkbM family methyltransferase
MFAPLKRVARRIVDRLQITPVGPVELIGGEANWALLTGRLPRGARVLSGGVGNDVSFEWALVERMQARVALFDPSPTGKKTMARLAPHPAGVTFFPLGLAGASTAVEFGRPRDEAEGSWRRTPGEAADERFECVDYAGALRLAGWDGCEVLKIDIEGFEYEFLASMLRDGRGPQQIAVETHGFLPGHSERATAELKKALLAAGYVHAWKRRHDHLFVRGQAR